MHRQAVRGLMVAGADPGALNEDGDSVLIVAIRSGREGIARVMALRESMRPMLNHRGQDGCTALWWACCLGYHSLAKALIDKGADVLIASDFGKTPLDVAIAAGRDKCAQVLRTSRQMLVRGGADSLPCWLHHCVITTSGSRRA
jgi:ankyrin repeat protein